MPVTDEQARSLGRRLLAARGRILSEHGFYGLLLMNMKFAVGDEHDTAWVSRDTITFNPEFSDALDADELCFVLEHEVMHAALGHLGRLGTRDPTLWNLACDIVVNSNIKHSNGDDPKSITLRCVAGESFHLTPGGEEGWHYTADEVYEMLRRDPKMRAIAAACKDGRGGRWDWHIIDDGSDPLAEEECRDSWLRRLADAKESMSCRDPSGARGLVPACATRRLDELHAALADWRLLLNEFVQEEVCDYSFTIPDRRFSDAPFILPGFSDTEAVVRGVLFMADTSASVSNKALTAAFSEVKGAIEQFSGKLEGWIGFFDAIPYEPSRFESVSDLAAIRPKGGGGTRFEAAFACVDRWLDAEELSCIVIITDGYAPTPKKSIAKGIPVLWLLVGHGPTPAWGKVARLYEERFG